LTLADVSARCGTDQPVLSRLENGHTPNPTLDTLWRYAAALGKRSVLTPADRAFCGPLFQKVPYDIPFLCSGNCVAARM